MASTVHIGNITCQPGGIQFGAMPGVSLRDGSQVNIPLIVVNGASGGPALWLGSTVHGNEIPGIEVIRRVIRKYVDPQALRGTILACPLQNPLAYHNSSRLTPDDRININRVFPGNPQGSWTERFAQVLFQEGIAKADVVLDYHATNGMDAINFNLLRTCGKGTVWKEQWSLAHAFGITIATAPVKKDGLSGMLHDAALATGRPALTVELSGGYCFEEASVQAGVTGTLNVMKSLGMIKGEIEPQTQVHVIEEPLRFHPEVRATKGGLVHPLVPVGQSVNKGQPIIRIYDVYGEEQETIPSPVSGWIVAHSCVGNCSVASGDGVFFVGSPGSDEM